MGLGSADKTGLGDAQDMSHARGRLRAVAIRRMMRRMRDIKANAGPIVLGVTFLAGLAWLLLGCGGATDRSGPMSEPARTASDAAPNAPAADAGPVVTTILPAPGPGVDCATPLGDFVGCDGQSHAYVVGYSAESEGPQAPADSGLMPWKCWALQVVDPAEHVCPPGNACEVWAPVDGGLAHAVGTCTAPADAADADAIDAAPDVQRTDDAPEAGGCVGPLYLWDGGTVVAGQYCCR